MTEKTIVLAPFSKWSPKFRETFFEKIGPQHSIKSEEDMAFAKEIRLVANDNKFVIEIDWKTDAVEMQKKDLPAGVKKQLAAE